MVVNGVRVGGSGHMGSGYLCSVRTSSVHFSYCCDAVIGRHGVSGNRCRCCRRGVGLGRRVNKLFIPRPSRLPSGVEYRDSGGRTVKCINIDLGITRCHVFVSASSVRCELPRKCYRKTGKLGRRCAFLSLCLVKCAVTCPSPDAKFGNCT